MSKYPKYENYLELYQSKSTAMGVKTPVSHRDKNNPIRSINSKFKEISNIDEHELYRVFNMGIGYIFVVSESDKDKVIESAAEKGEKAFVIGRTVKGSNDVKIKGIDID